MINWSALNTTGLGPRHVPLSWLSGKMKGERHASLTGISVQEKTGAWGQWHLNKEGWTSTATTMTKHLPQTTLATKKTSVLAHVKLKRSFSILKNAPQRELTSYPGAVRRYLVCWRTSFPNRVIRLTVVWLSEQKEKTTIVVRPIVLCLPLLSQQSGTRTLTLVELSCSDPVSYQM